MIGLTSTVAGNRAKFGGRSFLLTALGSGAGLLLGVGFPIAVAVVFFPVPEDAGLGGLAYVLPTVLAIIVLTGTLVPLGTYWALRWGHERAAGATAGWSFPVFIVMVLLVGLLDDSSLLDAPALGWISSEDWAPVAIGVCVWLAGIAAIRSLAVYLHNRGIE